jgi:hypothetical protein
MIDDKEQLSRILFEHEESSESESLDRVSEPVKTMQSFAERVVESTQDKQNFQPPQAESSEDGLQGTFQKPKEKSKSPSKSPQAKAKQQHF